MMFSKGPAVAVAAALAVVAAPAHAADAARGKALFKPCGYCHGDVGQGGAMGPPLKNIVGRKAAQGQGFGYSPALKASGLIWTEANLAAFLAAPQAKVKGTRMVFGGFRKPGESSDVIAYLKTIR